MTEFDREAFEEAKRQSFLQMLFKAARLANERSIARFREATGREDIRLSHTAVFPHVPFEGIRLTDLADKLGVTKQATQSLVDELEQMGMLERVPDPTDGRAKLIRWSEAGSEGMAFGVALLRSLEGEYRDLVGAEKFAAAHDVLTAIVDHLESMPGEDADS